MPLLVSPAVVYVAAMAFADQSPSLPWEIARRYSMPVPRYTSYPPAPAWQPADAGAADAAYDQAARKGDPVSLYVHIPFCERMCLYCGCNVIVAKKYDRVARYLDALERELELVAGRLGHRELVQLHFGGGTPTFLSPADLERIITAIFKRFPPAAHAELGIEVDPVVTTREHLATVRRLGLNRLSMGVQDFDDEVQEIVQRRQPAAISRRTVALGRELGFASINLDLMYGLPGQTTGHLERSAAVCLELGPDRIALFGYAHVPHMKPHQKKLEAYPIPTPEARWAMFNAARAVLQQGGYQPIGMDHFAKPNDELAVAARDGRLQRNFQGYTVLAPTDLVGIGVSAISDVGGSFLQNSHTLPEYLAAIEAGRFATERSLTLSSEDSLRRRVIIDIMCNLRLNYADVQQRFGIDFQTHFADALAQLGPLQADGLCEVHDDELVVTEPGRPLVRMVALAFDAYSGRATGAKFSNAI